MHLVVFGANGPTGRLLTRQALDSAHEVTAVTRHPSSFPFHDARLHVVQGDALDAASVREAVAGKDAVLSTLGTPYSRRRITLYSEGTGNIVAAMQQTGVRRLVCVSSSATYPVSSPGDGFVFAKVLQPFFIGVVGRTMYDDLRRMETLVSESDLDWVIVRPSGLFDTSAVTRYQMAEGHLNVRFTSRADLADCMLQQASSERYLRKALAVATVEVKPSMLKLLWREGISKSLHRPRSEAGAPATGAAVTQH
ncbi:MAG: SDR family oxidoreductase [Candidatus Dormiibacterota bacterium]